MSLKITVVLAIFCLAKQCSAQEDLDDIIKDIFNVPNTGATESTPRPNVPVTPAPVVPNFGGGDGNDGGDCKCVEYYLCDPNNKTIATDGSTDGYGLIDIRFGENRVCEHYLDVCCSAGQELPAPVTTARPIVVPNQPTTTPRPRQCGIRNSQGVGFQITGNVDEAEFGEFPWMVAVLKKDWIPSSTDILAQCGGSLIHPQVVLTAAHCTFKHTANELKIRAGEWDTQTTKEALPYQERNVAEIIAHQDFNPKSLANDIALLILEAPVTEDRHISTVCLPQKGEQFTQRNCFASGWGKTVFGLEGQYQVILKKIELPMVNRRQCQSALRTTRLGPKFQLHHSFVCAGGEAGKDTCKGDGGSPLVCPGPNGRFKQAGIVAWGIGCGEKEIPGVYGDVAQFRDWIDDHMYAKRFSTDTYRL